MEENLYSFKEVCNITEFRPSVIRYYEKEFQLTIPRDKSGRRIFTKNELDLFLGIKDLKKQGKTNREIKELLNYHNGENCDDIAVTIDEAKERNIKEFSSLASMENNKIIEEYFNNIDNKLHKISNNINDLNMYVNNKERDILISENMKLKLELKEKSYEVIDLKNKLKYQMEKQRGFFSKIFKK